MHEMSLCESVLKILEQQADEQQFERVRIVWLEIGRLSCVEKEAMQFSFDVVMKGSLADGAKLEIVDIPGEAFCETCEKQTMIENRFDPCSRCGGHNLTVVSGEEMRVKQLEVE